MREQPRQIYTSVRSQHSVSGASPSLVRTVVVAVLVVIAVAVIVVAVLSLA